MSAIAFCADTKTNSGNGPYLLQANPGCHLRHEGESTGVSVDHERSIVVPYQPLDISFCGGMLVNQAALGVVKKSLPCFRCMKRS